MIYVKKGKFEIVTLMWFYAFYWDGKQGEKVSFCINVRSADLVEQLNAKNY